MKAPIGTGPYKLVDYELNSRIVLERNEAYWGPKPKMKNVTFQIIKDPSARVAAIQSGQVDLTLNVPVREADRFRRMRTSRRSLIRSNASSSYRLAAISGFRRQKRAPRGTSRNRQDRRSPRRSTRRGRAAVGPVRARLARRRAGLHVRLRLRNSPRSCSPKSASARKIQPSSSSATTNGQFAGDYDLARAIQQMWKKVGLEAEIVVFEYAEGFELNRGDNLPRSHGLGLGQRHRRSGNRHRLSASIPISRSPRGRKRRSATRSPRFSPLPTTTSGLPPTKRSTRRRWSTGPSCRSCKA